MFKMPMEEVFCLVKRHFDDKPLITDPSEGTYFLYSTNNLS